MFELQNAQQKRIVMLACAALVFAFFSIHKLVEKFITEGSSIFAIRDTSTIMQMASVFFMTMAITYILIKSLTDYQELKRQHLFDSKTNLPNANALEEELLALKECDHAELPDFALLCVDIDRLKSVNDSSGHDVGDIVIDSVGASLNALCTPQQKVFKLDGGQFVLLAKDVSDHEWIISFSDVIFETIAKPIAVETGEIYIDVSIGATLVLDPNFTIMESKRRCEFALQQAKKDGGNCLNIYDEGVSELAKHQSTLEHHFREVLENEGLEVMYQPLIDSAKGEIAGVEALARWRYGDKGYVSPSIFVPIAKKLGLVNKLGVQVLNRACLAAVGLDGLKVAVNISPDHFLSSNFVQEVKDCLETTKLPKECLELEITEDVLLHNSELAMKTIDQLRSFGVSIALDDFGAGYSGLSYLHKFNVDRLKIDAAFIRELETSASSRTIVKSIVNLAKMHGMAITVEGIETKGQKEILADYPGLWYQGYLFSKPLSLVALLQSDLIQSADNKRFQEEFTEDEFEEVNISQSQALGTMPSLAS